MTAVRTVPGIEPCEPLTPPSWTREVLPNGLRVIAARRATSLLEVRLRVPFTGAPGAAAVLVAETVLAGTSGRPLGDLRTALHEIGGQLHASADADNLLIRGSALAEHAERLLDILADVVTGAAYPADAVTTARGRIAHAMRVSKNQPGLVVHEELNRRLYPEHPYGAASPEAAQVLAVDRADLAHLHRQRIRPVGATLVLVGDLRPELAVRLAHGALDRWQDTDTAPAAPPAPSFVPGPADLLHRPGAVQSSVRLAMAGIGPLDPRFAALQLANLVLGGYFSGRLVENLRERNGLAYTPGSMLMHRRLATVLVVSFEVTTELTAAALDETYRELDRISTDPIQGTEVDRARRYALGRQRLALTSAAGVAELITELDDQGADLGWFSEHGERLGALSATEVSQAAAWFLAPSKTSGVVLCDRDLVHKGHSRPGESGDALMTGR